MPALDWEAILARHEIFGRLEPEARRALVHEYSATERTYPAGEVILRQGETGDSIYLIGAGAAEVVLRRPDEKDLTLYTLGDGELFGEMALLERRPRSATVKAAKETTILEIPGTEFEGLIGKHPGLALAVLAKLRQRLRYTDDRILDSRIWRLDETMGQLRGEIERVGAKSEAELAAAKDLANKAGASIEQLRDWIKWVLSITAGVFVLGGGVLSLATYVGYDNFQDYLKLMQEDVTKSANMFRLQMSQLEKETREQFDRRFAKFDNLIARSERFIETAKQAERTMLMNELNQLVSAGIFKNKFKILYNKNLNYAFSERDIEFLREIKSIMEDIIIRAAPLRCESLRDSQDGLVLILCSGGRYGGREMGKPLSMDLRRRALAAVDAGMSRRAAAGRFGVSEASVIRWDAQRRATGSFAPKPQGGDTRSRRLEARHGEVMAAFEEEPDQSLDELRARLAERGVAASTSALSRFFQRHGITRKKDRARRRTGPRGRPEQAPRLVRGAARPRP